LNVVILKKLVVFQLVKQFSALIWKPKIYYRVQATGPYPEPDESIPHLHILLS